MSGRPDKRRRWIFRAILLGIATIAPLMFIEIAMRIGGVEYPIVTQRDANRGYAYRPAYQWTQASEGKADVRTNRFGFRDDEWTLEKPADTVRIAVLGDSYVDAVQVAKEHRFTELLERDLTESHIFGDCNIEVMNFGTSGYGTAQELMTYRHAARQFNPDFVILSFLTGNDIRNNSRKLEGDPVRPYFVPSEEGLKLDTSFRTKDLPTLKMLGHLAAKHSRIGQFAVHAYQALGVRNVVSRIESDEQSELMREGLLQPGLSVEIYKETQDKDWQDAWQVTEGLLPLLRDEVEADGASLLVAILTNGEQVHPDRAFRQRVQSLGKIDDLLLPDKRVRDVCIREGISVLMLAERMQQIAEKEQVWLHGFKNTQMGRGHWNEDGHREAGQLIADWFTTGTRRMAGAPQLQLLRH
jgi:hypothetical protein